jgi:hypothetical protein
MQRQLPSLLALWIALVLGSAAVQASTSECASAGKNQSAAVLAEAEAAVAKAAAARSLWLPAQEAIDKARRAHAGGDYRTACREARSAQDFARLGIDQLKQPLYER